VQSKPTTAFPRRRNRRLRPPLLHALLGGSLIERDPRCGKPGCQCAPSHGPKDYLSVSRTGARPERDYVPQADVAQVRQCLTHDCRRTREILDELCAMNRERLPRRATL
jgi:hypothetical protein